MSQEFLNSSDIISIFYKMRGKRVSESMTIVFVALMGVAIEHMIEWSDKKTIESKR
jgi:hypothetical protein